VLEGVGGIEEEPVSRFGEVNVHDNSVILNIILDSESIGSEDDGVVFNETD
jgi:hypothetical protein